MINFIIDGSWFYNNRGTISPIIGARVEFWQQVSHVVDWFDKHISSTYTDGNGQYFGSFKSGHQHNFYAKLVLNDDKGARLHNWWTSGSWSINTGLGSNTSGRIHHNLVISKDGGSSTPKSAIWQGAHNAYQEYVATVGVQPPDRDYDIALETTLFPTPWTTLNTTHWPDGYTNIGNGPNSSYSVNFHEFGHSVRHSFDGNFAHFLYDAIRFFYARTHSPCSSTNHGFAFNEGWAEFWATDWGATPPDAPCIQVGDMEREGNVAAALYELSQCADVGRAGMVWILQHNPGRIHSFDDFVKAFNRIFPECGVGVMRQGDTISYNVGEEVAISAKERIEATLLNIQQQVHLTEKLQYSYQEAVEATTNMSPCHTIADYEALFQVVTAPPLLAGLISQSKQLSTKLRQNLRQLRDGDDDTNLMNEALYAELATNQKIFDQKMVSTVMTATRQALVALKPFVKEDSTGTLVSYIEDLTELLDDFKYCSNNGLPLPKSIQPPGGTLGEVIAQYESRVD